MCDCSLVVLRNRLAQAGEEIDCPQISNRLDRFLFLHTSGALEQSAVIYPLSL